MCLFVVMIGRPRITTLTVTVSPYTTLFRYQLGVAGVHPVCRQRRRDHRRTSLRQLDDGVAVQPVDVEGAAPQPAFVDAQAGAHAGVAVVERKPALGGDLHAGGDRTSAVSGPSVSERVDLGGRRLIKIKRTYVRLKR